MNQRKHRLNRVRQVAPVYPHGWAYWRHLANAIEPSVCGDDAALCQIIVTTGLLVVVADVVVFVLHNQLFLRYELVFFSQEMTAAVILNCENGAFQHLRML